LPTLSHTFSRGKRVKSFYARSSAVTFLWLRRKTCPNILISSTLSLPLYLSFSPCQNDHTRFLSHVLFCSVGVAEVMEDSIIYEIRWSSEPISCTVPLLLITLLHLPCSSNPDKLPQCFCSVDATNHCRRYRRSATRSSPRPRTFQVFLCVLLSTRMLTRRRGKRSASEPTGLELHWKNRK
jgi:hypothetical protein